MDGFGAAKNVLSGVGGEQWYNLGWRDEKYAQAQINWKILTAQSLVLLA